VRGPEFNPQDLQRKREKERRKGGREGGKEEREREKGRKEERERKKDMWQWLRKLIQASWTQSWKKTLLTGGCHRQTEADGSGMGGKKILEGKKQSGDWTGWNPALPIPNSPLPASGPP
jgi:hypothetical protein